MRLLTPALLLPLVSARARAQDASTVDPPLPAASAPWSVEVRAYALPPQKVEYLTDDAPTRSCEVRVRVRPDGSHDATAGTCPEAMKADAVAATLQWRFAPAAGVQARDVATLSLRYHLQYSATLGFTTLYAELDPGPGGAGLEGRPGLQLVHGPTQTSAWDGRLPKAAKKAGVTGGTCAVALTVGVDGRASVRSVGGCAESLQEAARSGAAKTRWTPRTVDGQARPHDLELLLPFGSDAE
jgi:hypothetical protein